MCAADLKILSCSKTVVITFCRKIPVSLFFNINLLILISHWLLRTREHFLNVYFHHHIDVYFLRLSSSWVSLILLFTLFQSLTVYWYIFPLLHLNLLTHLVYETHFMCSKNLCHHRTCESVIKISVTSLCFLSVFPVKTVLLPGTHYDIHRDAGIFRKQAIRLTQILYSLL